MPATKKTSKSATKRPPKRVPANRSDEAPSESVRSPSVGSLARQKRALLDELKDRPGPVREIELRAQLEAEPIASAPIYSVQELARLAD